MSTALAAQKTLQVSRIAETLTGSEILKIAGEVNEKIKQGEKIYNLTIGDFNSKLFSIPAGLKKLIVDAYNDDATNYPPADGVLELRQAVSAYLKRKGGLDYPADQIVIAGGARPIIYATFRALLDPNDTVLFPVPSWNNNHYAHLLDAQSILVETKAENKFMPTPAELKPHLQKANLIALCSPLNPTGTTFTKEGLKEICDLIVAENIRRGATQKPLYLMYDQIYWALTFKGIKHHDPVTLNPAIKPYTIFIDGISKSLAATGVRVGWTFGPKEIMEKMKSILGHVGAWAPKAEQVATANFLNQHEQLDQFMTEIHQKISTRLDAFYEGFSALKKEGFKVDAIAPEAAIYLTVQFNLHGKKTADGKVLATTEHITRYLLDEAKIAIVPFYAFGSSIDSSWYRLSVGTCKLEDVKDIISNLRNALTKLS